MRQLDPVTNLVLSVLAGLGLLASLSTPWFVPSAASSTETDGPVERGAWQVGHFFKHEVAGRVSGTDAIADGRNVLVVIVAVIVGLVFAIAIPTIRKQAEDLLRVAGFAAPLGVVYVAASHDGTRGDVMIHYGVLVSFALSVFLASTAFHGATVRDRQAKSPSAVRMSR